MILVQQNYVKVIDAFLNEIRDVHFYELDLDTEDCTVKRCPGRGGGGRHTGAANFQADKFKNRFEANQQRWYKSLAPKLDKLAKDGDWKDIYLAGEREAVNVLNDQMNKEVTYIVNKNLLHHEESHVFEELSK